ncbi:alpha/beta hydrolase [Blastopirellula retiformator]|uniref:Carboxylesterase NlhH n=1 Tax=Blastopirellula retiformator TaxID=2527970 RepID=A0A5C5V9K9_9BACT|nr:alpha/beta hydrolase [Blastopirellula retiformator]TWT34385.1 Carboxylesterase NlhH [Blastopirellula retiformator]
MTKRHSLLSCAVSLAIFSLALAQEDGGVRRSDKDRLQQFLQRFPDADANKDGVLTMQEARAYREERRGAAPAGRGRKSTATHPDVAYGDHQKQKFDLWLLTDSDAPTPLIIFIHGGGFRGGDKASVNPKVAEDLNKEGIAYASLNYRLSDAGPYPIMMHDAARALQTIRHRAQEWNIDPERIVCYGGSAGAGISLWLAFHDDLADPDSDDPIARQSTRILAAATTNGQSSYDLFVIRDWFGLPDLYAHDALPQFYGFQEEAEVKSDRVRKLMKDASPINHLSSDDTASVYMTYGQGNSKVTANTPQNVWVHHVTFGLKLKEAVDQQGLECIVTAPGVAEGKDAYGSPMTFLMKKVKGE